MNTLLKNLYDDLHEYLSGDRDYTKFVIVCRSRTGSNMLVDLLNSNPQVRAYGEIFRTLGGKSSNELYQAIFPDKSHKTIGFKLFYYHPLDADGTPVWNYLLNDRNIKVLHLKRKNLLKVHLSRLIAGKTDNWLSNADSPRKNNLEEKKVTINLTEMFNDFLETNKQIQWIDDQFSGHAMQTVYYDELISRTNLEMRKIFAFLGTRQTSTATNLQKQNPEKLSELIVNYREVEEALCNTEYSFMLKNG